MYKRILVPIDGSDTAARGLAEAIALARELKATVRLLNLTSDFVLMVEMSSAIDSDKFREGLNQFGRRLLAKASEQANAQGVTAETSLHDLRGGRPCPADMPVAGKAELMLSFDTWCCDPALRLEPLRQFVADPRNEAPVPCASTAAAATRRAVGAPASCSA